MLTVKENVDLATRTTFHVSARTRYFVTFETAEDLVEFFDTEKFKAFPFFVLGGGSNVLFTQDFDGVVLHHAGLAIKDVGETATTRLIQADAGVLWNDFVEYCVQKEWPGVENLALIPGTVGGAAVQNIGAYGVEVAERIKEVTLFDPADNTVKTLSVEACDYGYRTSTFKKSEHLSYIILSVLFELPKVFTPNVTYKAIAPFFEKAPPEKPSEVADVVIQTREAKLPNPNVVGSAGSFFKNPVVSRVKMMHLLEETPQLVAYPLAGGRAKLAAGWLIDAVGYKGRRVGDAGVYEKNALCLVNYGTASGQDVLKLSQTIQRAVKERFGVDLEPEPVIL